MNHASVITVAALLASNTAVALAADNSADAFDQTAVGAIRNHCQTTQYVDHSLHGPVNSKTRSIAIDRQATAFQRKNLGAHEAYYNDLRKNARSALDTHRGNAESALAAYQNLTGDNPE